MDAPLTFDALCQIFHARDFPRRASNARPSLEDVRAVRFAVESALAGDAFLADCIERELAVIDRNEPRVGLVPFHRVPELGIDVCLGYWGPGQDVGAHEHNDWTVTAVCHNALEVYTYDLDAARKEGRLVQKNRHPAPEGKAGHIYDPCVHNPRNPTTTWSLSIHVIGAHDGDVVDGREPFHVAGPAKERFADPYGRHPFRRCAIARQRQSALRVLVEALAGSRDARAPMLLERLFARGDLRTRRAAATAMTSVDPARAAQLSCFVDAARIRPETRIVMPDPAVGREVRMRDGRAELFLEIPAGEQLALRVGDRARDALEVIAREPALVVGDLPGDLDDDERVELVETLLGEWSLFEVAGHGALPHAHLT